MEDSIRERLDEIAHEVTAYTEDGRRIIYHAEHGHILYEECTSKPTLEPADDVLFLSDVKSVDDMKRFLRVMVDRRRVRGSNTNDLRVFFESCLGYKTLKEEPFCKVGVMSVPQYKMLEKLGALIAYRNVIMLTREELCKHLECKDKNLMAKLKTLTDPHYIKVEDGVRKGEIKILVNPKFFYICEYSIYDLSREKAMREWYAGELKAQSPLFP